MLFASKGFYREQLRRVAAKVVTFLNFEPTVARFGKVLGETVAKVG